MTLMQTRAQLGNLFSNAEGKNLKKPVKTRTHRHTHIYIYLTQTKQSQKNGGHTLLGGVLFCPGVWRTLLRSGLLV